MYGRGKFNNPFFGFGDFFVNPKIGDPLLGRVYTFYLFQMAFAQTATTIVSGSVAERFYFPAYIVFSFFNFVAYSIGGGWIWGKF
jgi:Amt family ammonium transporter